MAETFSNLIQRCVKRLGMVVGTGVQVYAEDILAEMLQEHFGQLFDAYWWEDYMTTLVTPLTMLGVTATNMRTTESLDRFTDIQYVWYKKIHRPLGRLSSRGNIAELLVQGRQPQGILPVNSDKVFQLLPYGTSGENITVRFRARPAKFIADDPVLMDDLALIFGTVYDYLEDDGTNAGATEKMLNMYNTRLQQLKTMRNEQDIPLFTDNLGVVMTEWTYVR